MPIFKTIMEQLRGLNGANEAYYTDRYGARHRGFRVNPEDGIMLSNYYTNKAKQEAAVAMNEGDNEWRLIIICVSIPLA